MTKEEARKITELCVDVDGAAEDWFYILMTAKHKVSEEEGRKAFERIKGVPEEESVIALMKAEQMEENLEKYGVPCADWV